MKRLILTVLPLLLAATACGPRAADQLSVPLPEGAFATIDSATIRQHLVYLSSDRLEGRGTGTEGERLAVEYVAGEMRRFGLEPAGDDGTFFQKVPLLGSTPRPAGPLMLKNASGATLSLGFVDDFIGSTDLEDTRVDLSGDLVFVGYGIDAPGYDWHSFGDADVAGKILVMFVNDPVATAAEPDLFQADTLTYYGRWTYKFEEARRRGAKGVLLIHTLETAGYPFTVLSGHAAGEQIQLATPPENPLQFKGWLTKDAAERLARLAGTTLDAWFADANRREFTPQPLPVSAALDVQYVVRRFDGINVVGKLPGRVRPDEAVIYTAHHDHLGIGVPVAGDSIYNGAVDNATGVAMLLATAEAFSKLPERPARSVLFASVTAEESGLLGAEYYARNPHLPLKQTIANINVDSGNIYGRSRDIVGIGAERSDMMNVLREEAGREGLSVSADPHPNQGSFFRSDQLAFARGGVPAVYIETGSLFENQADDYAEKVAGAYNLQNYHQPSDEFSADWPLGGMVQQARVGFRIGYRLATGDERPQWKAGEAFAQVRNEP